MSTGQWIVLVAVVLALGFGLYRAATDGRFRGTHRVRGIETAAEGSDAGTAAPGGASLLDGTPWAADLGERATLVQFSSAFCAPCRTTRVLLSHVAEAEPGVTHIEIDAEHHLELVRRLGILRTPTTLVLDAAGRELTRAAGAPRREQVVAALP
jgi:thiol-disulfide isomerase/thioredoxin